MNSVIWTVWFQGRSNAPDLVKKCFASWEYKNPSWTFYCLDASTIGRYIDIANMVNLNEQVVTAASLSDIIRIMLLNEYGGVWVDATLYCNKPLDDWLDLSSHEGFFAFSRPAPDRLISSWFLACNYNNLIIKRWAAKVYTYWSGRKQTNDYFWFHNIFLELCYEDPLINYMWHKVRRISADGPHSIQFKGIMYEPTKNAIYQIDWSIPVFKLTHRIDGDQYLPGSLIYDLLSDFDIRNKEVAMLAKIDSSPMLCCSLKVSTENLGDHIQILAANMLLNRFGVEPEFYIDRDNEISSSPTLKDLKEKTVVILNGWHKTNPTEWPPHPNLSPIYLGFHIRLFQAPSLISEQALDHYRRHEPIGCRDQYTLNLLLKHGIDAFLSNCLSMLYHKRLDFPETQSEIFVVSRDKRIIDFLPDNLGAFEFISHYSNSTDFISNMELAKELLETYRSRAKLIVTTLLHCALPAIAMGIPVIVFYPLNTEKQSVSDRERFSTLEKMVKVFHFNDLNFVDWNGYCLDVSQIKLNLIDDFIKMSRSWRLPPSYSLGPIADSEKLPVPIVASADENCLYSSLRNRLSIQNKMSDFVRWGNILSYKKVWAERNVMAASLIPDNSKVLEIGAGTGVLKKLIENRCAYIGADLVPLDDSFLCLNIDADPLPDMYFDYIVLIGVLSYTFFLEAIVEKIRHSANDVIITYPCIKDGLVKSQVIKSREEMGWRNHFFRDELIELFSKNKFDLVFSENINRCESTEAWLFLFRK